jgi:hypothetical protein
VAQVITFDRYKPIARYDETPWTNVRVQEGDTADGPWTTLETIAVESGPNPPVDPDPSEPAVRSFTTELADDAMGLWYRLVFIDETGDTEAPTDPRRNGALPNLYVTDDEVKSAGQLLGETFADSELDIIIPAVCRAIDRYKRTRFYPADGVRYYTAARGTTSLPIFDANSITSVEVDADGDGDWETTWTVNVDFYLVPANAAADGYPYNGIVIDGWSPVFPATRNAIKVTASWGWAETPPEVKLAAAKLCVRELTILRNAPAGVIVASEVAVRLGSVYRDIAYLLDNLNPDPQIASLQLG